MIALTFIDIDKSWRELEKLDLDDAPALIDNLGKEQPYMLTYLMATGNDILTQPERETLLFMGVMVWQIVSKSISKYPEIDITMLYDKETKNLSMLEYLAGEPETDFLDTVELIMTNYHQAELLQYTIDQLLEQPEKGVELSDENIGMIVIYLKTIIDCLDSTL